MPEDLTPKIDKFNTSNLKCFVYDRSEVRYKNLCYAMSRNTTRMISQLMCICCTVCFAVFTLDAGLLARSQYPESPATGHLDTGFSWFPCVYNQMLRRFPTFQVATTCFSCSPPDLNLVVTNFIFCIHVK